MTYRTKFDERVAAVELARERVSNAMQAYSRGTGTVDEANAANRALADAHSDWRNWNGGRIPVRRDD